MANNLEESIKATEKIIDNSCIDAENFENRFSEYSQFYFWTNEDIRSCLDHVNLKNKNTGLTVLSSGDHPFNLVAEGVLNIDTFDINRLTEYFALGFKRAMILKYSYHEFIAIMQKISFFELSFKELYEIITGLFNYMELEHKKFWQEILNYTYFLQKFNGYQIDFFKSLILDADYLYTFSYEACNYTNSEEKYDALRKNLSKANISFKSADILDIPLRFSGKKYDIIMLSNILDYFYNKWGNNWTYDKLQTFERLLENISNDDCQILLLYLYGWTEEDFIYPFNSYNVSSSDLKDEDIITFPSCYNVNSGILLKRVKK